MFARATSRYEETGNDFAGEKNFRRQGKGGWLDFDVAIATPDMMELSSGRSAKFWARGGDYHRRVPGLLTRTISQPR